MGTAKQHVSNRILFISSLPYANDLVEKSAYGSSQADMAHFPPAVSLCASRQAFCPCQLFCAHLR